MSAVRKFHVADRGQTHAYLGDGKGKTTAAVGTAVRATGYGWRVAFLQFMKEERWPSGERAPMRKLGIDVRILGQGFYKIMNDRKPATMHRSAAIKALSAARQVLLSGKYQLVIFDELGTAIDEKLLTRRQVEPLLKARQTSKRANVTNLIITGHRSIPWLEKYCDLVTEMKKVKHPYDRGIIASRGIDY